MKINNIVFVTVHAYVAKTIAAGTESNIVVYLPTAKATIFVAGQLIGSSKIIRLKMDAGSQHLKISNGNTEALSAGNEIVLSFVYACE